MDASLALRVKASLYIASGAVASSSDTLPTAASWHASSGKPLNVTTPSPANEEEGEAWCDACAKAIGRHRKRVVALNRQCAAGRLQSPCYAHPSSPLRPRRVLALVALALL